MVALSYEVWSLGTRARESSMGLVCSLRGGERELSWKGKGVPGWKSLVGKLDVTVWG